MKKIQIVIPNQKLKDVDEIFRKAQVGGMTHIGLEGSGTTSAEADAVGSGTIKFRPEYIPRIKIGKVVKDDKVDMLLTWPRIKGKIFVMEVSTTFDIKTGKK